jgi:chromosome segregation ATPase
VQSYLVSKMAVPVLKRKLNPFLLTSLMLVLCILVAVSVVYQAELSDISGENQQLQTSLEDEQQLNSRLTEQMDRINNSLQSTESELSSLETNYTEIQNEFSDLESEKQILEEELSTAENSIESLNNSLETICTGTSNLTASAENQCTKHGFQ